MSQPEVSGAEPSIEQPYSATFVLIHCAFGGGWAWKYVAPLLQRRGHRVYAPSLTGLGDRAHLGRSDVNLETHIQDIVNLLIFEDLDDVILVGWSYGGMVVTGVLDRLPERVAHVVYIDPEVPRDGEKGFDFFPDTGFVAAMEQQIWETGEGWKAVAGSVSEIEAAFETWIPDPERRHRVAAKMASTTQPINTFRQPVRLSNPDADTVSRTIFRCVVDSALLAGVYDPVVERVRSHPHWTIMDLASNHMAPVADPDLVGEALLEVLAGLKE